MQRLRLTTTQCQHRELECGSEASILTFLRLSFSICKIGMMTSGVLTKCYVPRWEETHKYSLGC